MQDSAAIQRDRIHIDVVLFNFRTRRATASPVIVSPNRRPVKMRAAIKHLGRTAGGNWFPGARGGTSVGNESP